MSPTPLRRQDLPEDPVALGQLLLGRNVVRRVGRDIMVGRIVETEIYLPDDPASHSFAGATKRNASMFRARGHAYIYRIYGMWHCLNVTAGPENVGAAVLIRALEPIAGLDAMRARRGAHADRQLMRGPGRLCEALEIDLALDGRDLCRKGELFVAEGAPFTGRPGRSPRIGITKAADQMLRFFVPENPYVSGSTRQNAAQQRG